jgi:hypothetical protein
MKLGVDFLKFNKCLQHFRERPFNLKGLNTAIKQRLFDQFQQEWRSNMENSSKGICYKIFKVNFEFEPY